MFLKITEVLTLKGSAATELQRKALSTKTLREQKDKAREPSAQERHCWVSGPRWTTKLWGHLYLQQKENEDKQRELQVFET